MQLLLLSPNKSRYESTINLTKSIGKILLTTGIAMNPQINQEYYLAECSIIHKNNLNGIPKYNFSKVLSLAGVSPRLIKYHTNYLISTDDIRHKLS